MSQVLNALQRSEQEHYTQASTSSYAPVQALATAPRFSWPLASFALLLPSLCSIAYFGAQYVQDYRVHSSLQSQQEVEVVQQIERIDVTYTLSQVAPLQALVSVPKKPAVAHHQSDSYSLLPETESNIPPVTSPSGAEVIADDPLVNLDLSQLSPEIAQRLQSVMSQPSTTNEPTSNTSTQIATTPSQQRVIALAHNSNDYYGRLPAMNFQTHVYSRAEDKRWVKINDVEYMQGDELNGGVVLESIEPQSCVIRFEGERLRIPALYDWKG
ncbi:general secretion pathway protein GspB [Vibrio agarivorans]|uniref:general secretion pathway protein GspB n=1 Tax=Vibrio agarivorans TaxID=153622 RepID=UPI0022322B31|nr:general secretion pathway protein GspB [Vibrio agarivorans]